MTVAVWLCGSISKTIGGTSKMKSANEPLEMRVYEKLG